MHRVIEAVHKNAYSRSLQERKNDQNYDTEKEKKLIYSEFAMAEYLSPLEEDCTIDEQK